MQDGKFIPLSVPNLKGNELEYVTDAVKTEWVSTAGKYVIEFENKISEYLNVQGAVSCQNGTSALHISLILAGVSKEDCVIVPTLTFIAAVNPVMYIGAQPIFMDCDDSLCMDPDKLNQFCENECEFVDGVLIDKKSNKDIKALVVVHVFGNMADMQAIMKIASKYNIKVIEDATEALGTYYTEGVYAGKYAGTIGDFGAYSFNGNKIITTGGGGMIVAKDSNNLARARHLTTQAKSDELYYIHDEIGYNYRMTNLQAALGIAQMEQLEEFVKTKIVNYEHYKNKLDTKEGLKLLEFREGTRSNHWFYSLLCDNEKYNRDDMIQYLKNNNIQTRPIWHIINEQKPYKNCKSYRIEKARYYLDRVVNIPCSTNLKSEDVDYVMECIQNY